VNFLYDDIVHVLQNTIDSCINSATDRRDYVLGDTLRLLGAIEIHCNRAFYVSLNTNPNPDPNLALALTLTLSERNALLWRPVNYNLAMCWNACLPNSVK